MGTCPASNLMFLPVPEGKDAKSARVGESENAVGVNFATSVQLQNEPGWSVDGFPSCEHAPHTLSSSSQRVSAIQG